VDGDFPAKADGLLTDFAVGSQVAGYRLERQVGAGGMAVVFRAVDERLGRLVALKILAPALASDEGFRQRFIRESRAAAAVDDPHIIPVYEAGEADGVLFIAMRYVPGGDLRTLMHRAGRLPPARVGAIISPVASALDAAHAAGLVHRDVKPANMLVDARPGRPDHVYLSDFGLSKAARSPDRLTGTGRFLGTVDYISPEQIRGRPVDGRADQYALACAAFELLTGAPPFRRDDVTAVIHAQVTEPPPLLTSRRPDLPPAADRVFATALAKVPADRYPSCRAFADALREVLGLAPWDSGPDDIPAGTPPPAKFAWSPTPGTAQEHALAAAAVSPVSGEAGMSTGDAYLPAALATTSGPGPPGPGHRDPVRLRQRRLIAITLVVVTALVTAVAAVATLMIIRGHHSLGVQIAARSGPVSAGGDVYVRYRDGSNATAQIYGQVSDAASGEVGRPPSTRSPCVQAGELPGICSG
jgi:serine/threonine-protein kinase